MLFEKGFPNYEKRSPDCALYHQSILTWDLCTLILCVCAPIDVSQHQSGNGPTCVDHFIKVLAEWGHANFSRPPVRMYANKRNFGGDYLQLLVLSNYYLDGVSLFVRSDPIRTKLVRRLQPRILQIGLVHRGKMAMRLEIPSSHDL